jgi:hypothetical protein
MKGCVAPAASSGVARAARNENVSCDRECRERSCIRTRRFAPRGGRRRPPLHKMWRTDE